MLAAGAAVLVLAACSGEPSGNDIKEAIRNNAAVMMQMRALAQMSGGGDADELINAASVEKGQCTQAQGQPGFVCDFRLNAGGQTGPWGKARFFNANGWQLEQ
ncbi:MAG TPA: hypothetical protein VGN80_09635 [Devosiaceae bacterium]|jgi:hypothetical protein|nr:hypothetical protein [Devosiaceae bacterium]